MANESRLNLAHLRAFHAVASEGSFSTGARALGVTQPTVSAQVRALEDRYGVRLFDRRGRHVEVTETGRSLLEFARGLFTQERAAEELLSGERGLATGRLRVGADGPHHVIPVLAEFLRCHPGVEISLAMGNADRVLADVFAHRVDVAIVARVPEDPRLMTLPVWRGPLVVFVPRTHAWAKRSTVRLAEIGGERMIVREAASVTRHVFEQALTAAGVRPAAVMQIESREAVREAVAAGLGVGVVAAAEFDPDRRLKALKIRDAHLEIAEHAVCLREQERLHVVAAFLELIQRQRVQRGGRS